MGIREQYSEFDLAELDRRHSLHRYTNPRQHESVVPLISL